MKIGFILPLNGISGGIYVVYHHASYLTSLGHEVTIIFASDAFGIEIKSVRSCALKTMKLEDVVNSGISFDVVIATWWETYYEMFQIPASHYMYFCQSDERRFYASKIDYEVPFVEHTYLNKNVGIITMARWIADWLKKEYGIHAEYAPNGIDMNLFNPDVKPLEPKENKIRVLIEGPGSVLFKRVDSAFRVANRFPNIEIWYVSNGDYTKPEWKFDRMFSQLSLDEMPAVYASCDILLKLSSVESFSYPPLEMMACGGTAVVTKFTGHEEYIKHEENALLVEVDNDELAYSALKRLIEDANLRKQLSQGGIQTAKKLDWNSRNFFFLHAIEILIKRNLYVSTIEKNNYTFVNHLRKLYPQLQQTQTQLQQTQTQSQQTQTQLQQTQTQLQQTQTQLQQTQTQLQQTQTQLHDQMQAILNSKTYFIGRIAIFLPKKIYLLIKRFMGLSSDR